MELKVTGDSSECLQAPMLIVRACTLRLHSHTKTLETLSQDTLETDYGSL
jgi:hypothetical protein